MLKEKYEKPNTLLQVLHYVVLLHHWFVAYYSSFVLDFHDADLQYVKDLNRFPVAYVTTWNFAGHMLFFSVCALQDAFGHRFTARNRILIQKIQDFLFTILVYPGTMLVLTTFWGFYFVDRELVLPRSADEFVPQWFNHSLHTFIFVAVLLEIMLTRKRLSGPLMTRVGLGFFCVGYDSVFLYISYVYGVSLYPFLYNVNSWVVKLLFLLACNTCYIIYYIIGAKFFFVREKQM
ncbi:androgen-dependent TFPI-regulating protein-like [Periplaneta americana]|uniref:androgen-dependent TFPI-regulating protein-like n=1 Tax=Periplaneta americana TaxID=6978 RepID=UPI0037E977A3